MESSITVNVDADTATLTLTGKLEATNAPHLMEELKQLMGKGINKVVFQAEQLSYISSAGLRTIIFAKQKIGSHVDVYLIGAQDAVLEVVKMSGLETYLEIQDTFTP